jgi:hypothetical protein
MARSIQGAYLYICSHIHSNGKGLYERLQVHFRFTSRDNGKGGIKFFSLNEREEVKKNLRQVSETLQQASN